MSKSEFAYILVRFSGVILLGWSGLMVFDLIVNLVVLSSAPQIGSTAAPVLLGGLIKFIAFMVAGFYLVKDGAWIADIIEDRSASEMDQ